jgi:hypothetical protein
MKNRIAMWIVAVFFALSVGTASAQETGTAASGSTQAVAGDVEKVSPDGKSITVKTADGDRRSVQSHWEDDR